VEVKVEVVEVEVEVEAEVGVVVAEKAFLQENKQQEASRPKHQPSTVQSLIFSMGITITSHTSAAPSQSSGR
jgi:hypothetical protein